MLILTGKVVVPTGGYRLEFVPNLTELRSYPVQLVARLLVFPPEGPATQALVTHDLRWQWPVTGPVGTVAIRCGTRMLATVTPVEAARPEVSCASVSVGGAGVVRRAQPSPSAAMDCGIVGSSDWTAWVNAMPGPNARPTLIVTGKVTVPSGATQLDWGDHAGDGKLSGADRRRASGDPSPSERRAHRRWSPTRFAANGRSTSRSDRVRCAAATRRWPKSRLWKPPISC